jgi:hypothetical protein
MKQFYRADHEWAVFVAFNGCPSTRQIALADIVDDAEKTGDGMRASRYTRHGTRNSSARAYS